MDLKDLPKNYRRELRKILMDSGFFYSEVRDALNKSATLEEFVLIVECNMESARSKALSITNTFKNLYKQEQET